MSVKPSDFLDFAENVLSNNDEISCRNAISRSYYSLYHSVCGELKYCPPTSHHGVISYLRSTKANNKESLDPMVMRRVAAILEQTKKQRQVADYDLNHNINDTDAKSTILLVKKGLTLI